MPHEASVRSVLVTIAGLGLALSGPAACQTARSGGDPPATPAPGETAREGANDYSDTANWLCLPARDDACAVDLTTTVVAADGSRTIERWTANPDPPVDCFYVYPTVSQDPTPTSDMLPGPGENGVVRSQLARFASQCRVFAPLYRQFTLAALRGALTPGDGAGEGRRDLDRERGYRDVLDAWSYYLSEINGGRGVVLIGHSQGASILMRLIAEEIDGTPVQGRIVSAMLLGANVAVPRGRDVGGTFRQMPLCRSATETTCIVTYSTYRSTVRPGIAGLFGRVAGAGMIAGCTNPAALGGGEAELHAYLPTAGLGTGTRWTTAGGPIETGFVSLPGLLTSECVQRVRFGYLEVTVHGDASDPRTDDIPGDVMIGGEPNRQWGLHLIDMAVAMGDLVDLVGRQAESYLGRGGGEGDR